MRSWCAVNRTLCEVGFADGEDHPPGRGDQSPHAAERLPHRAVVDGAEDERADDGIEDLTALQQRVEPPFVEKGHAWRVLGPPAGEGRIRIVGCHCAATSESRRVPRLAAAEVEHGAGSRRIDETRDLGVEPKLRGLAANGVEQVFPPQGLGEVAAVD